MISSKSSPSDNVEEEKEVLIECPKCRGKQKLSIPVKVINQAKQLTTISVPSGVCCEHAFQAFVDKNFKIRGYQKVDFELSKMEFLESAQESQETEVPFEFEDEVESLTTLPFFQNIIDILRESVDDKEILGSGLFSTEGQVIYSSLPSGALTNLIKEFEARTEKNLSRITKMFLVMETKEITSCQYLEFASRAADYVLVIFCSSNVKLGMSNLYLRQIAERIENLEKS